MPLIAIQQAQRRCPICGSTRPENFLQKAGLSLERCTECSMIYVARSAAEFADARFYATEGSQFYASDEKLAGDYSPVRYTREISLLRRFCRQGSVLDIGCSTGGFLYHLRKRFPGEYEIVGNDVALGALEVAKTKGVPVLRDDFCKMARPDKGYDAITFWAVLEHVAEPSMFLRKAHELLGPEGRCFVLVPNIRSLACRLLGAKYRYILPQHLNYFSEPTLSALAVKCGFQVLHSTTTHFNPAVIWQDYRGSGQFVADADRARLLTQTNALKGSPLLFPLRFLYRATEFILSKRGLADNLCMVLAKTGT